ncbi:MAG: hypothetical protein L6R42_001738 [Xanthoria sp. 1 TBL-2021]|nr:MAG: hypothetical protein L6R42_001738 [Xanthoria sp. 1 TBL-2021]
MPMLLKTMDLPESSAPTLQLVQATEPEIIESSTLGSISWKGPLDTSDYLRREAHLRNQRLTRDGGITYWILVDTAAAPTPGGSRRILASCETIRKRALIAQPGAAVRETICHGIGSVHCNQHYRGRGFGRRMMVELANILDTWQQKEGERADCSVLWSDIGKDFYARLGWKTYPSKHIALPPKSSHEHAVGFPKVVTLASEDIYGICSTDEANLRSEMAKSTLAGSSIGVALIPDAATMRWHHAREEFLAKVLLGRWPTSKGAMAEAPDGERVWCIWTRTFGASQDQSVLHILRLSVEGESNLGQSASSKPTDTPHDHAQKAQVKAIAAVLQAAQVEAFDWGMSSVQIWNPSPLSILAARHLEPSAEIVERHDESLASLRWHGKPMPDDAKIDWISNEKFGWC